MTDLVADLYPCMPHVFNVLCAFYITNCLFCSNQYTISVIAALDVLSKQDVYSVQVLVVIRMYGTETPRAQSSCPNGVQVMFK